MPNMELINKNSKVIKKHEKFARFSPFIRLSKNKIFFPVSLVELASLQIGKYFHFIDAGPTTLFVVNDDPAGYKLSFNDTQHDALRCSSSAAVNWFRTKHKIKGNDSISFFVNESLTELNGQKIYEILTDSPRPEVLSKRFNR